MIPAPIDKKQGWEMRFHFPTGCKLTRVVKQTGVIKVRFDHFRKKDDFPRGITCLIPSFFLRVFR